MIMDLKEKLIKEYGYVKLRNPKMFSASEMAGAILTGNQPAPDEGVCLFGFWKNVYSFIEEANRVKTKEEIEKEENEKRKHAKQMCDFLDKVKNKLDQTDNNK